ncbi:putative reverse transcriptase domain-containing protein [Tanacetum coccineum]
MESSPLMNAMAVENVVENESHFSLKIVDQDLSSLAMFTKHLMGKHCGGRGGSVGSNSGVGEGKVESMGGIGGGSFAKRSMVAKDGLGGDGFVVDGGRSPSKSRKDGEDGGVENKSSMGSRLIVTGEWWSGYWRSWWSSRQMRYMNKNWKIVLWNNGGWRIYQFVNQLSDRMDQLMNKCGNRNVWGTDEEQSKNLFGEDNDLSSDEQSGRRPRRGISIGVDNMALGNSRMRVNIFDFAGETLCFLFLSQDDMEAEFGNIEHIAIDVIDILHLNINLATSQIDKYGGQCWKNGTLQRNQDHACRGTWIARRSLFQESKREKDDGTILRFKMPDMVHDVACELMGNKRLMVTGTHNKVDQNHESLGNLLRCLVGDHVKAWDQNLCQAEFAHNHAVNRSTGFSPFQVVYFAQPRGPLDLMNPRVSSFIPKKVQDFGAGLHDVHKAFHENLVRANSKYKQDADHKWRHVDFEEGDFVWAVLTKDRFPVGEYNKLSAKKIGPLEIVEKINSNAYRLKFPSHIRCFDIFNVKHLIPYHGDSSDDDLAMNSRTNFVYPEGMMEAQVLKNGLTCF